MAINDKNFGVFVSLATTSVGVQFVYYVLPYRLNIGSPSLVFPASNLTMMHRQLTTKDP